MGLTAILEGEDTSEMRELADEFFSVGINIAYVPSSGVPRLVVGDRSLTGFSRIRDLGVAYFLASYHGSEKELDFFSRIYKKIKR